MLRRLIALPIASLTLTGLMSLASTSLAAPATRKPAAGAKPVPAMKPSNMTFDAYMSANASHPALNSKVKDHQNAFVDPTPVAVITFSNDGSSVKDVPPPPPPPPGAPPPPPVPGR